MGVLGRCRSFVREEYGCFLILHFLPHHHPIHKHRSLLFFPLALPIKARIIGSYLIPGKRPQPPFPPLPPLS